MNSAQIHLALNHVPLFLSVLGALVLISSMIRKNKTFRDFALYLLIGAAIFTLPVFFSGEGTEEIAEKLAGVNEARIEQHEEMAKIAMIIISITGVIALTGLLLKRNATASRVTPIALIILSLAAFGTMAQTAHLGGLIRHSELGNTSFTNIPENGNKGLMEKDDD